MAEGGAVVGAAGAAPEAGPGAAAVDPVAAALALAREANGPSADEVAALEAQRKVLARQRAAVATELNTPKKRQQRNMERARNLSDEQLLGIITARAAMDKAKEKAKAKAKAA